MHCSLLCALSNHFLAVMVKLCLSSFKYKTTVGPPNTADLGTDEKATVFGNRRYWESYVT